ncbi:hypothetical protein OCOL_001079 [Ordospora colligata]|uniref:Lysophospholipid acyltransferase n=1 Tax=Ordospora colligata OC4 TaxID=1354746 RepID=A0A0B2UFW4_9MICR|nr:lysophospholipid acyltransferase [Ordospora colligata OC4]KHN69976.1 lysophospholipid acyltransferase [Ordospora colligata OC4]TBU16146.1 lysophospholipid acyltransferase [Ordospora colligata]TBU16359.1 lysophospholipid acyltransferase [Ordospora colligata]
MQKIQRIFLKWLVALCIIPVFIMGIPVFIIVYPISLFNRKLVVRISTLFTYLTWSITSILFNISCRVEGNNILDNKNYFVISNHLGSVDFMLINEIAKMNNMIAHSKYTIKEGLKVFPVLYQGMVSVGFLVLKRCFEKDRKRIIRYFEFFKANDIPIWFILYPEGSRFKKQAQAISWEYSDKNNVPRMNNVLFPRYKGFKLICEQLRGSRISEIADITFSYSEGEVPPLWKFLLCDVTGHFKYNIRIVPINQISDYESFLYKAFERKDALITEWKTLKSK